MKNILDDIVENKKIELVQRKTQLPQEKLKILVGSAEKSNNFIKRISHPYIGDISLIAEIKLKSPSGGILGTESEILKRIQLYKQGGADAISVIADNKFFGGSLELIKEVKTVCSLPVIQKDFVIDPYQIYESAFYGADALLLIARILSVENLIEYVKLCKSLSVVPLVEVYDEKDLEKALQTDADCIGVNARNLETFTVNIQKAAALIRSIPRSKISVGLSGIYTRADVKIYQDAGARAILVGTSLMRSNDIQGTIQELKDI